MRVLIADHRSALHETIVAVVRDAFELVTVRHEKTLDGAISAAGRGEQADLVLLDLGLPGCKAVDALRRFRDQSPSVPTVVFSKLDDKGLMLAALKAGAAAYLPNTASRKVMVAILHLVVAGGVYLPIELLSEIEATTHPHHNHGHTNMLAKLTDRQRQVLRLLLKGHSNSRIAAELHIALGTVKQHAHAIYEALDVSSRAELFAFAVRRRGPQQSITTVV